MKGLWDNYGVFLYLLGLMIGTIVGIIVVITMFFSNQIIIYSWSAVFLFALGTFLWIIPVQFINGLKLIHIQRRVKRILFPYALALIQISFFALYIIGLDSLIEGIAFSNNGLIFYLMVILLYAKIIKEKVARENEQILLKKQESNNDSW